MEREITIEFRLGVRQTSKSAVDIECRITGLRSHRGVLLLSRRVPLPVRSDEQLQRRLQSDALQDFRDLVRVLEGENS